MISSVRGTLLSLAGSVAVIEVGGIGLAVAITPQHALSLRTGSEVTVHTALIVREDDLSLYGFADRDELSVFDLLRGVTGVGPKSAMGVLAAMTPDEIARAVNSENDSAFRKVSGIGPKTAKLIVLSLAGKLVAVAPSPSAAAPQPIVRDSVVQALIGLGWNEKSAQDAADEAISSAAGAQRESVPALLRLALSELGPSAVREGAAR
ncbi:Holliday junction branch migration protein RuvA [Salinibacterium hongtaonis]|uniref:Holliday junction branch migration complex subunit RuvA n=1 Tax=Homoserinimonas hongtaonis TaxID=2079791 RepID=A0A2U1SYP6_9MICO|nr:Holliday junction branch migration protein RuvA [Salinibacterium hongtaonis]PWB96750.1 Holliday junction branch migration protein RuvA [Salinibacterium hongtaonis]